MNGYLFEKLEAIGVLEGWVIIGKQFSYIAERGSAEQSVGYSVKKNVGIRVTEKPLGVGDIDSADYETSAFDEAVDVIAVTYTHIRPPYRDRA